MTDNITIHQTSSLGRIVVPRSVPEQFALFYTTIDFPGRLDDGAANRITDVIHEQCGVTAALTTCTQVHGATVRRATASDRWSECDSCDALWSSEPHTALGIKMADCLPVTFIDATAGVIANVHSGWRGAVQRITQATVARLRGETTLEPARTRVWLGPTIRVCCFEVGEDVIEQFASAYADAERYVDRTRGLKPHLDLAAATRDALLAIGFNADDIIDTELCTRCEGSVFHSYRRDRTTGRNLAIVAG